MSDALYLKKISVQTTGMTVWGRKNAPEAGQLPFPVGVIYGTASGIKKFTDTSGEVSFALEGQFGGETYRKLNDKGEDHAEGSHPTYASGLCFLPAGMQDALVNQFAQNANQGPIDFALEIAMAHAPNAAGYTWVAKSLIEPVAADPLAALREKIAAKKRAQLAAPSKTDAPKQEGKAAA